MTMLGYAFIAAFFGIWAGWWVYARKRGWSHVIGGGGGFLAAVMLPAAISLLMTAYEWVSPPELPATLQAAGLRDKTEWNDQDYKLASQIMIKDIYTTTPELDDAVQRGDQMKAVNTILAFSERAGQWPSAYGNEQVDAKWRPCRLAMTYLMEYAQSGTGKTYMENNVTACRRLF